MDDLWIYAVALLAGILAGFINTLAGSGSLITLPMLIFLGLPAPVANGTNRVGVLFQNLVGIWKFRKGGQTDSGGVFLLLPSILGGLLGAYLAVDLDEHIMHYVIAGILGVMAMVILMRPEQWLRAESDSSVDYRKPMNFLMFFAIGCYGGFIQAGVGIFLLAAMVLRCGFSMKHANTVKLVIVLALTLPATLVFALEHQINWSLGLLMACGQSAGAWLAASFALQNKQAAKWMHRLLLLIIATSIAKLLGLLNF